MEFYWKQEKLLTQVHLKENQLLKYLNVDSTHTNACFKAIPYGVTMRLATLTSATDENIDKPINEIYPDHAAALSKAGQKPKYLTLRELKQAANSKTTNENEEPTVESIRAQAKKDRERSRVTWFCIGYSKIWGKPISARLKILTKKYKLTWLRNSMSYHKFSNLGEKFNSDLTGKTMEGVFDRENRDRECNCNARTLLPNGKCLYDGKCRVATIVYKLRCKETGICYYGKTQRHLKTRTAEHFTDVWKVIEYGRAKYGDDWYGSGGYPRADAFAKHFANRCRDCYNSNAVKARLKEIVEPSIVWQGDRIRCMKSARTYNCKICMIERKEILKQMDLNKSKVMNDNSDIFSSCKCGTKFHKFLRNVTTKTLMTRLTQKEVPSGRSSKTKRKNKRFSFNNLCQPCTPRVAPVSPEPASPPVTPVFLYDRNIPGFPYRSPTAQLTNLERAQLEHFENQLPTLDV